jgi:hypothetical protein
MAAAAQECVLPVRLATHLAQAIGGGAGAVVALIQVVEFFAAVDRSAIPGYVSSAANPGLHVTCQLCKNACSSPGPHQSCCQVEVQPVRVGLP